MTTATHYDRRRAKRYADHAERSDRASVEFRDHANRMAESDSDLVRGESLRLYRLADEFARDADEARTMALEFGWHDGLAE